jgi:hypothetical protein
MELFGIPAVIFQHEYDHLDGVRAFTFSVCLSPHLSLCLFQVLFIDHFNEEDLLASRERLDLLSKFHRDPLPQVDLRASEAAS